MVLPSSSSLLLSSLELSDTKVYQPLVRALLGTAAHFCQVVGSGAAGGGGSMHALAARNRQVLFSSSTVTQVSGAYTTGQVSGAYTTV